MDDVPYRQIIGEVSFLRIWNFNELNCKFSLKGWGWGKMWVEKIPDLNGTYHRPPMARYIGLRWNVP